uniref:Carbonic anhydrase n=1 Tax=Neobodo designis TaxID=312471 RepID=A0A7S1QY66_NEODS|mmetsp:Transcript_54137/g.166572  ORF Transcript_54137/g.166572 Transcript_54137/m.166572 type:complete len:255 (+) Transcript_54137:50-814(+)
MLRGVASKAVSAVPLAFAQRRFHGDGSDCRSHSVADLLNKNKEWADSITSSQPNFFKELAKQQTPEFLWIGCSDSRVPANQIVGLAPGEVFVHRNIANVVVPSDLNCLSVMQFAIEHLKVKHVIVCGHYNCGGVRAALTDTRLGLADNWTRHVRDIYRRHTRRIEKCGSVDNQVDLLCELNVIQQLHNVAETTIVRDAWAKGSDLKLHGLIYGLADGKLKPLVELDKLSERYAMEAAARRIIKDAHVKHGVAEE